MCNYPIPPFPKDFAPSRTIFEEAIYNLQTFIKMENQTSQVKQLRKDLDIILQRMKEMPGSRENLLSITKLQEAIMWQGMVLKGIGESNPYPESYNPDSDKIEPTADGLKL